MLLSLICFLGTDGVRAGFLLPVTLPSFVISFGDETVLKRIVFLGLIVLTLTDSSLAQQPAKQKTRFVAAPPEIVLMTVVSQPGCSIAFENLQFLEGVDGQGSSPGFVVRNNGSKPIREFTIGGPDWTMSWSEKFTKKLLMPGESAFEASRDHEVVPLTDELRTKLNLKGPMKAILVVMVIEVKFADGTTFDARPAHEALRLYTENLMGKKTGR